MRTIVVLGGGGMKGIAHIGAWKAIEEAGIPVSEIVGTSIGALIGGCVAGGRTWSALVRQALGLDKRAIVSLNRWTVLLNGIRQPSVFLGERFRQFIAETLPVQRFDELRIPLQVNAVNLESGHTEWFGVGGRSDVALADAVYASCALPLFYPPAKLGSAYYVDGGVGDALAIERARERGADLVIAVDASSGESGDSLDTVSRGLVAIHHRVYDIMADAQRRARLAAWDGPPLVHVRPRLDGYSTFDFEATPYFLEEGYRAARQALVDWSRATIPAD